MAARLKNRRSVCSILPRASGKKMGTSMICICSLLIYMFATEVYVQQSHNYEFESDTDTEVIAKLVKYLWDNRESDDIRFSTLVERVMQQMVRCSFV